MRVKAIHYMLLICVAVVVCFLLSDLSGGLVLGVRGWLGWFLFLQERRCSLFLAFFHHLVLGPSKLATGTQ